MSEEQKPFNRLSPAEAERLDMLAEEAAEIIVAVSKIKRHGYESRNPDEPAAGTNRRQLEDEVADFLGVWDAICSHDEVYGPLLADQRAAWAKKLRYSHHQVEL